MTEVEAKVYKNGYVYKLYSHVNECFYIGSWSSTPLCAKTGVPTVFVTFIVFWTLMLEEFIDNADTKYRVFVSLSFFSSTE